jgi:phosphatidylglycerophosphate synthase
MLHHHANSRERRASVGLAPPTSDPATVDLDEAGLRVWPQKKDHPNLMTLASIGCHVGWLLGAPFGFALLGLLLDELDGRYARATGTESALGAQLDWTGDVALAGATAVRLGPAAVLTLPVGIVVQAVMRDAGQKPSVGSLRAAYTLAWPFF